MSDEESLEAKIAALAEDYRRSLGATRLEIMDAWRKALAGDEAARARLLVLTHRLCGSAASFGLQDVAKAAELVESALRKSAVTAPHADLIAGLEQSLYAADDKADGAKKPPEAFPGA